MRTGTHAALFGLMAAMVFAAGCGTPQVAIRSSAQADVMVPASVKRVAVLNFQTIQGGRGPVLVDGRQIATNLIANLSQEGYYELVERSAVENVRDELAQSATLQFDRESQKQIGKLLNADALIFGSVKSSASEQRSVAQRSYRVATGQYRAQPVYDQYGNIIRYNQVPVYRDEIRQVPTLSREVNVNIDFRMVDVETGKVIASKTEPKSIKTRLYEGEYVSQCPAAQTLADQAVKDVLTGFVRYISPHHIVVNRFLLSGESKQCGTGYDLAMKGNWDMARQSWEAALRTNAGDASALNNLAVAYEREGNNAKALEYYQKALTLAPGNEDIIANVQSFRAFVYKRGQ